MRKLDFPFINNETSEKTPPSLKKITCQSYSVILLPSTEVGNPSRFLNSDYYSFVCENCKMHKLKDFPHPQVIAW